MKTRIQLNIGLSSKTLGTLNPIVILNALTGAGFIRTTHRIAPSSCEDGAEDVLAWQGHAPAYWERELTALAKRHGQDCIAYRVEAFSGPSPYDEFDASLWKSPVTEAGPSDCQAMQARHAAKAGETVNGWTRESFRRFLTETLIPDLLESGSEATAQDFETALAFMAE